MDMQKAREIARGAEAVIEETSWYGKKAVKKHRIPKGYRLPELDRELRRSRTRAEARLFRDARSAGFPTPMILDMDMEEASITMEYLDGPTAKAHINEHPQGAPGICEQIGVFIGRLHGQDMVHGDLTTSNIILMEGGPVFIDMGLGGRVASNEEKAVDLHLIKEALESTHNHIPGLYEALLEGYRQSFSSASEIEKRTVEIEKRGRYT